MSRSYSRTVAKKLQEVIDTATDPRLIIEAANVLAKYLPRPKQPRRRRGTPVAPIKKKEPSLNELVMAVEKGRKEKALTAQEEAALNGGSTGVG